MTRLKTRGTSADSPRTNENTALYTIEEISLADTDRLFRFKEENLYGASFSLKGFEYPWILSSHKWRPGDRVLDVGAGYASFARHLAQAYGCDAWIADDFGTASGEPFWERGRSPQAHIAANPEVAYVLERLGRPADSSLPEGTFDVVFSASALEHVPPRLAPRVWNHMDRLLKPGGRLIHAVDVGFPSNYAFDRLLRHLIARALWSRIPGAWRPRLTPLRSKEFAFAKTHGVGMVAAAACVDAMAPLLPKRVRWLLAPGTPRGYVRMVFASLGIRARANGPRLGVLDMVLDPRVVSTSYDEWFHLMRDPESGVTSPRRAAALLIHLRKRDERPPS